MTTLTLDLIGSTNDQRSFDVRTSRGGFAGIITERFGRHCVVYFNFNATKGSQRKFPSVDAALQFIYDRRVKKGWGV